VEVMRCDSKGPRNVIVNTNRYAAVTRAVASRFRSRRQEHTRTLGPDWGMLILQHPAPQQDICEEQSVVVRRRPVSRDRIWSLRDDLLVLPVRTVSSGSRSLPSQHAARSLLSLTVYGQRVTVQEARRGASYASWARRVNPFDHELTLVRRSSGLDRLCELKCIWRGGSMCLVSSSTY
jgi:hypothetical protein